MKKILKTKKVKTYGVDAGAHLNKSIAAMKAKQLRKMCCHAEQMKITHRIVKSDIISIQ